MNHQPYEEMLLEDRPLSPSEKEKLSQHLAKCPQCTKLEKSLRILDHEFKVAPVVAPEVGFSSRWKDSLPARRQQQRKEQNRIIYISMAATALATGITLAAFLLPPISPITIVINLFADLVRLVSEITQFLQFIGTFLKAAPTALTVGVLLTLSTWISITLLAWGISIYRITLKGVRELS